MYHEVLTALGNWILRTTKEMATPEEIAVLPEVAEVFLAHYSCSECLPSLLDKNTASVLA